MSPGVMGAGICVRRCVCVTCWGLAHCVRGHVFVSPGVIGAAGTCVRRCVCVTCVGGWHIVSGGMCLCHLVS